MKCITKQSPDQEERRIKRMFALTPVRTEQGTEVRWLEWVTVEQVYHYYEEGGWWTNLRFVEE